MDLFLDPTRLLLWLRRTSIKTFVSSFNKKVSLYSTLWWVCHLGTAFHAAKLHRSGRFRQRLRNLFDEARDVGLDCYGCTGHQAAHYSRPHVARFQARNTHRQSFLEEGTKASYIYKYITKWNKTFNKTTYEVRVCVYVCMYVCLYVCIHCISRFGFPLKMPPSYPAAPNFKPHPLSFQAPGIAPKASFTKAPPGINASVQQSPIHQGLSHLGVTFGGIPLGSHPEDIGWWFQPTLYYRLVYVSMV